MTLDREEDKSFGLFGKPPNHLIYSLLERKRFHTSMYIFLKVMTSPNSALELSKALSLVAACSAVESLCG